MSVVRFRHVAMPEFVTGNGANTARRIRPGGGEGHRTSRVGAVGGPSVSVRPTPSSGERGIHAIV